MGKYAYIFDGISLSYDEPCESAIRIVRSKMRRAGMNADAYSLQIYKKSVDARRRDAVKLVYSVCAESSDVSQKDGAKFAQLGARNVSIDELEIVKGNEIMRARPLVVGMGPAGMFCALILAENGYAPIIIDRGDSIADRVRAVKSFYTTHDLDTESNVQFGAGGAGTFSDGKLLTRINDSKCAYVLETFKRFGAPDEVTVKAKPHIGTDILRSVVDNILGHIERLGGDVIYRCKLTDISTMSDGLIKATTTKGDFVCSSVVLALGHSARDTYGVLLDRGFDIIPKPISVGVRIEHKREHIERALYGDLAGHEALGAAEYALSDTKGERGVYTFCMCPGGEVVAAASEEGEVVVNGMSNFSRDGDNSNSAIAVSVRVDDYEKVNGSLALGAIEFQRKIERAAFLAGGGGYSVPVQTVGDFLSGVLVHEPGEIRPTYMGGNNYKTASMDSVLPAFVTESLRYGIRSFDKKLNGFANEEAILSGAETRTSSPLRILRGENMTALGHDCIYPCGEGAGYAGGITSAAVDGIKVALSIMAKYKPLD
ncbi:MAG: 30S ribosomal protein S21 [Ruminococcaceae bacterium]|nr:30S ribosomal protein S21 [Oscillospiraceae bacterium]